ncbi:MAG: TIGR03668 family PPOX class F420-dependent oxidoreductase [Acidobacteria bacterium]|nr:MAG: TIGR03668 family PPOX class F420-dependent oxidoreductase [Acidobacteriota bacterium]
MTGTWRAFLQESRVARLATASRSGQPLVVPICYVYDGERFYSAIDRKPKRVPVERLRRVRHIRDNPNVCLIIDAYDEDWSKLRYAIVQARAEILWEGDERQRAIVLLRQKYRQYEKMDLTACPVIKLVPQKIVCWRMSDSEV